MDLQVIDDPAVAVVLLDPVRARVLASLAAPGSASTVASLLGEPRQKVNYHVRTLEEHGLLKFVEKRPRRGLMERIVQASARSYVLSPVLLGSSAADPSRIDRWSTSFLIAVATRLVREVADLARRADGAHKPLATLTIDTDIRFATAASRAAFTQELAKTVERLAARFHDEATAGGRWHRLVVASHPRPTTQSRSNDHV